MEIAHDDDEQLQKRSTTAMTGDESLRPQIPLIVQKVEEDIFTSF